MAHLTHFEIRKGSTVLRVTKAACDVCGKKFLSMKAAEKHEGTHTIYDTFKTKEFAQRRK